MWLLHQKKILMNKKKIKKIKSWPSSSSEPVLHYTTEQSITEDMDVTVSEVDNLVAAAAQRLAESGDKDSLSRGSVLEGILELENKSSLTTEFEQKNKFDQAAARNENKLKTVLELLDIAGEAMHALPHTHYDSDSDSASRRPSPA